MKRLGALVVAAVIVLSCCTAALAATQNGTLTSREYILLGKAQNKEDSAVSTKKIKWKQLVDGCEVMGSSTGLLETQRISCLSNVLFLAGLVDLDAELTKCGTATVQDYACLATDYSDADKYADAMYVSDRIATEAVVKRGFAGLCRKYLAFTSKELSAQDKLASAAKKIAEDTALATEVDSGQQPSTAFSISQAKTAADAFRRYADEWYDAPSPGKLSDCAHS